SSNYYFNDAFKRTDNESILSYQITFRNQSNIKTSLNNTYIKLLRPFDPTNIGKGMLAVGTEHQWNMLSMDYVSKPQGLMTYQVGGSYGGYYNNGIRYNFTSQIGYRFQPHVSIVIKSSYNHL